jgi:hypothetical protein
MVPMLSGKMVEALAILAGVVLVFIGYQMLGLMGGVLPVIMIVPLMLLRYPKRALMLYWVWVLFSPTIEFLLPIGPIRLVEQLFAVFLFVVFLGDALFNRVRVLGFRSIKLLALPLLAWIGISAMVNDVPTMPLLHYMAGYVKHLVIIAYTVRFLEPRDGKLVFFMMLGSFAIQFVFNLAFVAGINPLPHLIGRSFFDSFVGTLYSCHNVGYYMIAFLLLLLALGRNARELGKKIWIVGLGVLAFVHLYFTFTIHGYAILAIGVATQLLLPRRQHQRVLLRLTAALSVTALVVLLYVTQSGVARSASGFMAHYAIRNRMERMAIGLKGQAYRDVFMRSRYVLRHPWVGGGPGNYTSNTALVFQRPLATRVMAYARYGSDYSLRSAAGSILGAPRSGILAIWGELGPLGTLLYWSFYFYAGYRIWSQNRNESYPDLYRKCLAEALPPMMVGFFVLSFLVDVLPHPQLNLGLWIWAGALWNPGLSQGDPVEVDE